MVGRFISFGGVPLFSGAKLLLVSGSVCFSVSTSFSGTRNFLKFVKWVYGWIEKKMGPIFLGINRVDVLKLPKEPVNVRNIFFLGEFV